ncbi:MAG: TldE/PmbA family protein [Actinomyces sp.]|nr:MAG: TldE/PmbA family protein [Actinomyces sp.]
MSTTATWFDELVTWTTGRLRGDEVLLAHLVGEDSQFVRFNHAAVRQATSVHQRELHLELVVGARHAGGSLTLAGDLDQDRGRVSRLLDDLRDQIRAVPEDPHLDYNTEVSSSERLERGTLPDPGDAVGTIRARAEKHDLVGVYAAGDSFVGFANSLGQRNWFETTTFNLDWSLYLHDDKAAKNLYAGRRWDDDTFASRLAWSSRQLEALARPPLDLKPGEYRAYLAPAALREITDLLSWGGFSEKAHRTRTTPLLRMVTEGVHLHPAVTIREDTAGGVAPDFQSEGFRRPDRIVLVDRGTHAGTLVSPRTAREYGIATNGAESHEFPQSLAIDPGDLATDSVLDALGTGLYIGNLWYLNFSDRSACRTTGMTRFATFWVDGGEIVAPVQVLRFDDTAYHLLGDRLEGLTDTSETILDSSTYGARSMESVRLPGALVGAMRFTL